MRSGKIILSGPLLLLLLIQITACATGGGNFFRSGQNGPGINVAILSAVAEVTLSGEELKISEKGRVILNGRSKITVAFNDAGISIDHRLVKSEKLAFQSKDQKLIVNGRPYRGRISIIREKGALTVINSLGLEAYLMGIINHEISSKWPIESVKAQAVAARTYAYLKINSAGDVPYHLKASFLDQVYGGSLTEDERGKMAVNETRGQVLFYESEVARALYHSSCGGHTESARNVWGQDYPYLRSVEDKYCTDSPNYFWIYRTEFASILDSLAKKGFLAGEKPQSIKILERSESGRVKKMEVAGVEMSGDEFRQLMGYQNIKSTLFSMESELNEVIFSGSGSGHGVGMCQWGARGMALSGFKYKKILEHYYKGTYIRKVY